MNIKIIDENKVLPVESINNLIDSLRKNGKTFTACNAAMKVFSIKTKGLLFDKKIWHLAYKHKNKLVRKKNLKRLWGDNFTKELEAKNGSSLCKTFR